MILSLKNHMKKLGILLLTLSLFSFTGKMPGKIVVTSREDIAKSSITFVIVKPHALNVTKIEVTLDKQLFVIDGPTWQKAGVTDEMCFEIPLSKTQHLLSPSVIFYSGGRVVKVLRVHDDFMGPHDKLFSFYKE